MRRAARTPLRPLWTPGSSGWAPAVLGAKRMSEKGLWRPWGPKGLWRPWEAKGPKRVLVALGAKSGVPKVSQRGLGQRPRLIVATVGTLKLETSRRRLHRQPRKFHRGHWDGLAIPATIAASPSEDNTCALHHTSLRSVSVFERAPTLFSFFPFRTIPSSLLYHMPLRSVSVCERAATLLCLFPCNTIPSTLSNYKTCKDQGYLGWAPCFV